MLLTLVGRLVSVMINICKKQNWGGCGRGGGGKRRKGEDGRGGRGEGEWGKEGKGSGRWGGRRRKGKGKEILLFREQENILNGGRVEI